MKIHYYDDHPNFGDILNKYLWQPYFGELLERDDDILIFGIGTLLGQHTDHKGRIIVCGSGCGYLPNLDNVHKENVSISFVRGPLTAATLGLEPEKAITDPAILTPSVFPPKPKEDKIIFVPHYETAFNPLWKIVCEKAGVKYVSPMAPVEEVLGEISSAKLVITEAMHGAIIADLYRVPWVPVMTSSRINQFKWKDWSSSLGFETEFYVLPTIGWTDVFRTVTNDIKTAKKLKDGVEKNGHSVMKIKDGEGFAEQLLNWNKLFYKIPRRFNIKIEKLLIKEKMPKLDQKLYEKLSKSGETTARIDKAVEKMMFLAKQSGHNSPLENAKAKKAQMIEHLATLKESLK